MQRNFLVIGIIILIVFIIAIYSIINKKNNIVNENKSNTQVENNIMTESNNEVNNSVSNLNNDNNPKEIVSLLELPVPDSIIFYHNGLQKTFIKESNEFNEIIKLNNKRDSGKLGTLQLVVDIDSLLKNNDMLEYSYQNYNSVYFNLIKDEQLGNDNKEINWVSVGYDSKIFKQFIYSGLSSSDELINYLYSVQ